MKDRRVFYEIQSPQQWLAIIRNADPLTEELI